MPHSQTHIAIAKSFKINGIKSGSLICKPSFTNPQIPPLFLPQQLLIRITHHHGLAPVLPAQQRQLPRLPGVQDPGSCRPGRQQLRPAVQHVPQLRHVIWQRRKVPDRGGEVWLPQRARPGQGQQGRLQREVVRQRRGELKEVGLLVRIFVKKNTYNKVH